MRMIITAIIIVLTASVQVHAQELTITGPNSTEFIQGRSYAITWLAQHIDSVDIVVRGANTPLGGESRGEFTIPFADSVPAERGRLDWTVPWIDSTNLSLEITAYDSAGQIIGSAARVYGFRAASMAGKFANGIYLDLHETVNQRLYLQKSGRIIQAYLCTSSREYDWRSPNNHPSTPHDHAGVFRILDKTPMHWSKLFQVEMPWAMRYNGGHFIHATSPDQYEFLGTPASSGCNRLTYTDAQQLYRTIPTGTRLEIIGP